MDTPQHVLHLTFHPARGKTSAGLEEVSQWFEWSRRGRRTEWPGGEMVREGRQKPGEETKENRPTGRAGESHHNTKQQHQVCHYPQVHQQQNTLPFCFS